MHVFAFDETPLSDNRGTVRVQFSESKWKPPRNLIFDRRSTPCWLKAEHQVWLHGLNPKSTYLFTVRDDFAELRKDAKGRIRRALCMEPRLQPPLARPPVLPHLRDGQALLRSTIWRRCAAPSPTRA